MTTDRQRRGASWWAVLGVVVATLALPAPPASANHTSYSVPENKLGYSACAWPAGAVIRVGTDPAFPFPDPTFSARLDDAIARWNEVLSTSNRGGGMVRSDGAADVVVQYRAIDDPADPQALGETYLQWDGDGDLSPDIGRCPDRQPTAWTVRAAQVRVNPRPDWFAGDDSSVGVWEMCSGEGFRAANPGLCGARADVGSTLIHELGHALVFYHPQTLDDIDGIALERTDSASTQARCVEATGSFGAQATLCAQQGPWRAEQRTLETWDVETAHRHYS